MIIYTCRQVLIILLLLSSLVSYGQVEVKGSGGNFYKKKIFKKQMQSNPVFSTSSFAIAFNLYDYEEDQGGGVPATGGVAKAGVNANLTNISDELLQEITNEAYAYLVESMKKRSLDIKNYDQSAIEASKAVQKQIKKGNAEIAPQGGVITDLGKRKHVKTVRPSSFPQVISTNPNMDLNNNLIIPSSGNRYNVLFRSNIGFMDFKKGLGSTAKVSGKGALSARNQFQLHTLEGAKFGSYTGGNRAEGSRDWVERIDTESTELFAGTLGGWNVVANPEKYKEGVLEMLKAIIDDALAQWEKEMAN